MKYLPLGLFLMGLSLLSSCKKNQVVGKIEIRTTMENLVVDSSMVFTLHWFVDIQDKEGIEQVTIQFSNTSSELDFPDIFQNTWSKDDKVEFENHSIPKSWTMTVIVRDQAGNISEQNSTIDLQ